MKEFKQRVAVNGDLLTEGRSAMASLHFRINFFSYYLSIQDSLLSGESTLTLAVVVTILAGPWCE